MGVPTRGGRNPGCRGEARHHGDRHDGRSPGKIRRAPRRRPGSPDEVGHPGGRRPGGSLGCLRPARVLHRSRDPGRRRFSPETPLIMIRIDSKLTAKALRKDAERLFEVSAQKIRLLAKEWNPADGSPVFTVGGKYRSRGWTEWTQGFLYGSALLQFDATGDAEALAFGRDGTLNRMASHVSHVGVHDHGFNNVSTYGNLHRLA